MKIYNQEVYIEGPVIVILDQHYPPSKINKIDEAIRKDLSSLLAPEHLIIFREKE